MINDLSEAIELPLTVAERRLAFSLTRPFSAMHNPSPGHEAVDYATYNLTGILGEFALAKRAYGDISRAFDSRMRSLESAIRSGRMRPDDGGSDIVGCNLDVKTTANRKGKNALDLNLFVRPEHHSDERIYCLVIWESSIFTCKEGYLFLLGGCQGRDMKHGEYQNKQQKKVPIRELPARHLLPPQFVIEYMQASVAKKPSPSPTDSHLDTPSNPVNSPTG